MVVSTVAAVGLCSCSTEPGADDVASTTRGIQGELSFSADCEIEHQIRIAAAVLFARDQLNHPQFKQCVTEAFILDTGDDSFEDIALWANTQLPIVIECVDSSVTPCGDPNNPGSFGKAGCAGGTAPTAPEALWLDFGHIENATTEALASTITHEVMHNHGYGHPHSVGFSVSDQVGACVARDWPFGLGRAVVGDEFALTPLGGGGGALAGHRCASNEIATGIRGSTKDGRINRLGLMCGRVTGNTIVGSAPDADGSLGSPSGSTAFVDQCPAGQALVALEIHHDNLVNAVRPRCATLASLKADLPATVIHHIGTTHGLQLGTRYVNRCDHAGAVTGLNLRVGGLVDRVEVECETLPRGPSRRDRNYLTYDIGGVGGQNFEQQCQGRSVMTGIFGSRDATDRLASVGATCRPLTGDVVGEGQYDLQRTEVAGHFSGTPFNFECPVGEVVVGYQGRAANWVRSVVPMCIRYQDWVAGQMPQPAASLPSTGLVHQQLCPAGQVATGLDGREGAIIDRFGMRCERPEGAVYASDTVPTGGAGGSPFTQMCPGGAPISGLLSQSDSAGLVALGAHCPIVRGDEIHQHNGLRMPQYGGIAVPDADALCGASNVLVGVETRFVNGVIRGVQGLCQSRTQVLAKSTSVSPTGWRGEPNFGFYGQSRCPSGELAIGLKGRSGALIDRLQLVCGLPEFEVGEWLSLALAPGEDIIIKLYRPTEGYFSRITVQPAGAPYFVPPMQDISVQLQQRSRPESQFEIAPSSSGNTVYNGQWWDYRQYFGEDHYLVRLKNNSARQMANFQFRLSTD